jgi:superfamily II DNA or RNA helicase
LEPLQKALKLPRVNLFIADDVGLGKTIEAGLIACELLLRRRIQDIVVACPPGMILQWKEELDNRFGLTFEIFDRDYLERIRRERGHGVNAWETFPRFLISHKLLIDETYSGPLRNWLDNLRPGSMLILDEAHHAAPASGSKYAIDSQLTRQIRDLAGRFEHRLFLSATPHNGHSNSFSALLEILDKERFIRGVRVLASNRDAVMVRRLKEDLRAIGVQGFPKREIVQVELPQALGRPALPDDAPELLLPSLLEDYRQLRLDHLSGAKKRQRNQFELLVGQLQQRLLSSTEAFARTLDVHRKTMERIWNKEIVVSAETPAPEANFEKLKPTDTDDDVSQQDEKTQDELQEREAEKATIASALPAAPGIAEERKLLETMADIAQRHRQQPDTRVRYLVQWIRDKLCAEASLPTEGRAQAGAPWTGIRVIIFTEWDDTKRYLHQQLSQAIHGTDRWEKRIAIYHGPTPAETKEALKQAFNQPPEEHPVRILIATDAAREGLNLQAHCYHLFHFDVPWNPARLEQRNGRIDRKLQPQPVVYCHYFFHPQRPEDRVLRVLTRKAETIRLELGSFNEVVSRKLKHGIRRAQAAQTTEELAAEEQKESHATTEDELESTRKRLDDLRHTLAALERRKQESEQAIQYDPDRLRDALSCSLELMRFQPIQDVGGGQYALPNLETRAGADPRWSATLDALRAPPQAGKRDFRWRRQAPVRPLVFAAPKGLDDKVVQMHLSHRLVQRLLGHFSAQGFILHDLSRACLAQSEDNIPRVALLGRLSVYGPRAARLHEEILTVTARWIPPGDRGKPLTPFAREAEARTMEMLQNGLAPGAAKPVPPAVQETLKASMSRDVTELLAHLEPRGQASLNEAREKLTKRGEVEAAELLAILQDQKARVSKELAAAQKEAPLPMTMALDEDVRRQEELERRQRLEDIQHWRDWLQNVDGDIQHQPHSIRQSYAVHSHRIEPLGIVYLWPGAAS